MEGIAIALGVASLVLAMVVFLRGGLLGGSLAVLLAGCCFGYPLFNVPTKPVPLTFDRVLWVVLILQYAIWRQLGWTARRPLGGADLALLSFVGVLAASAFLHDWEAHNGLAVSRLTFFYGMPLGVYWSVRQSRLSERAALALLSCLAGFGVYLAITAVAEVAEADWLVFPPYIMSPAYPEFFGRARGPLLNPIGNGILLGTSLTAGLLLCSRLNRLGKLAMLPLLLLMAAGACLSLTRSVWIGTALAILLVVGLAARPGVRRAVLVAAAVTIALVGATQWEHLMTFKRDRFLSADETAESARLRPILATVAWQMFLDRPLWGCGFGQYGAVSREYFADRSTDLPLEKARPFVQHNVFLGLLTETGLAGMGLFVALLLLWTRDALALWRAAQAPLFARQAALVFLAFSVNYVVNGMFHDVAIIPMVHMFLFFLAGVTEGLRAYGDPGVVAERPQDASAARSALQVRPVV